MVGSFQEASKDLHHLLVYLADSKLRTRGLARDREGDDWERSVILTVFRRELSLVTAKVVSACLLGKVFKLGEGHRKAAKRRVSGSSMRMREEKQLVEHTGAANVFGRGIHRSGKFVIPW